MRGFNVLSPMGWDSFGLPAENAAIGTGAHPRENTEAQIVKMADQIKRLGAMYDWNRELASHPQEYYRWDQWLFLQLYDQGLAYKRGSARQLVPSRSDGACQRAGRRRGM